MANPDNIRHHSIWMLYGQGIAVAFQTLYFILIGRTLGSNEYGAFVGVVALVNVLSQFSSLGMEMILVRNISRDPSSFASTWGMALRTSAYGFIALLAIAMAIGHLTLGPQLQILIPYIALSDGLLGKFVQLASRAFQGARQLANTAKLTALMNATRTIVALVLFAFARVTHIRPPVQMWTRVYWVSSLVTAMIALGMVTKILGKPKFKRMSLRELTDGLSFSLSSSSISAYNDIDKTFLVSSGQFYAAGIYSAAYRIIDIASIPIYAIYTAASPQFFRDGERGICHSVSLANRLLKRTIPYGVIFGMSLFIVSPLLPYLFGSSFQGSAGALRWLCLLPLIRGLHYAWGTAITGASSQWYRTGTQLSAAVLNIMLNAFWIPRWSWHGAAVASVLTDGILAASSWCVVRWLRTREQSRHVATQTAESVS